jgi:hypothetical protein
MRQLGRELTFIGNGNSPDLNRLHFPAASGGVCFFAAHVQKHVFFGMDVLVSAVVLFVFVGIEGHRTD